MPLTIRQLQEANANRNLEWDTEHKLDLMFFSTELAGEVGETLEVAMRLLNIAIIAGKVCNLAKKIRREELNIPGSRADMDEMRKELSDLIICASNEANKLGIDLESAIINKFNADSEKHGFITRIVA